MAAVFSLLAGRGIGIRAETLRQPVWIVTLAGNGPARAFRPYRPSALARMLTIMKLYDIHAEVRKAQVTAVARAALSVAELGPWLGKTYAVIAGLLAAQGAGPAGPPFARFHPLGGGRFEVEAGFPAGRLIDGSGDVQPSGLPGGQVAVTVHIGPYDQMEPAYQALVSWVGEHGGELAGDAWEVYFSDPSAEPDPATWRTEVVQPYRQA